MNNEFILKLNKQVYEALKNDYNRYLHSIGVANTCANLAMRYSADMEKAYIAGLLHDCVKCFPDEQLLSECRKYGLDISDYEKQSPYLLHAKLGAWYAKNVYNIEDDKITSAICYHTTGKPDMTVLEEIVFISDYIEPFRNRASNLELIRTLAYKDLKEAVYVVTKDTLDYLNSKNKTIDPMTYETYKYYKTFFE